MIIERITDATLAGESEWVRWAMSHCETDNDFPIVSATARVSRRCSVWRATKRPETNVNLHLVADSVHRPLALVICGPRQNRCENIRLGIGSLSDSTNAPTCTFRAHFGSQLRAGRLRYGHTHTYFVLSQINT